MMKSKKTVKASLFTLMVALIAIGTVAVAAVVKKDTVENVTMQDDTETWYFTGTDPLNPEHYSDKEDPNKPCDTLPQVICSIEAPIDTEGYPKLDELVYDDITESYVSIGDLITRAVASISTAATPNAAVKAFRSN